MNKVKAHAYLDKAGKKVYAKEVKTHGRNSPAPVSRNRPKLDKILVKKPSKRNFSIQPNTPRKSQSPKHSRVYSLAGASSDDFLPNVNNTVMASTKPESMHMGSTVRSNSNLLTKINNLVLKKQQEDAKMDPRKLREKQQEEKDFNIFSLLEEDSSSQVGSDKKIVEKADPMSKTTTDANGRF